MLRIKKNSCSIINNVHAFQHFVRPFFKTEHTAQIFFAFIENVHRVMQVLAWLFSAGTRHKIENWDIASSKIRCLILIFFGLKCEF